LLLWYLEARYIYLQSPFTYVPLRMIYFRTYDIICEREYDVVIQQHTNQKIL
jgi:hypothetical protein